MVCCCFVIYFQLNTIAKTIQFAAVCFLFSVDWMYFKLFTIYHILRVMALLGLLHRQTLYQFCLKHSDCCSWPNFA